jgi:uncharacterized protein (TIGR00251 family)
MVAYRVEGDGIVLSVRLTPRGGRDAIDGLTALADGQEETVLTRVRAAPAEGAANAALVRLLAEVFGVPRSRVTIVAGATARLKRVKVVGNAKALAEIVESWR